MTLYIIQSTGEMTECSNKEVALASTNVLVVISHLQKRIYTWIGGQSSPHSKFACARETARLRMELGYKIVNLEESSTSDEFLQAVDEACNIQSDTASKPKPKPVKPIAKSQTQPEPVIPDLEPDPEPKAETKTIPKKEEPKDTKITPERKYTSKKVETSLVDIEHIITQLKALPPLDNSIRDYILVNDTLYIAPENLENPDTESKVKLPNGSFVADDYTPRLYLEDGKIIAIELWRQN